jgi:hypothetical protein
VSALARSEEQEQPPLVLVHGGAAYTFMPPEALAAVAGTIGVPAELPGPANGVPVGPPCPECGGDGAA